MHIILQVGSLGLPGTQWDKNEILDAKTQAEGLGTLLWKLMERGELCVDPSLCVVIMGLGSGANAVLHFAGNSLLDAKFAPLRNATRFLTIINPFPVTSSASTESQQVKRSLQTMRRVLESGTHHEKLQFLITTLFSSEYVKQVSARVYEQNLSVCLYTGTIV